MPEIILTTKNDKWKYHLVSDEDFDSAEVFFDDDDEIIGSETDINTLCKQTLTFNQEDLDKEQILALINEPQYLKCKMHLLCEDCFTPMYMCIFLYEGFKYADENKETIDSFYQLIRKSTTNDKDTKRASHISNIINDIYKQSTKKVDCPICFNEIEKGKIIILNCGHYFDEFCINKCLSDKMNCPICRNIVD